MSSQYGRRDEACPVSTGGRGGGGGLEVFGDEVQHLSSSAATSAESRANMSLTHCEFLCSIPATRRAPPARQRGRPPGARARSPRGSGLSGLVRRCITLRLESRPFSFSLSTNRPIDPSMSDPTHPCIRGRGAAPSSVCETSTSRSLPSSGSSALLTSGGSSDLRDTAFLRVTMKRMPAPAARRGAARQRPRAGWAGGCWAGERAEGRDVSG